MLTKWYKTLYLKGKHPGMPCHELGVEVFTLRGWMSMSVMVDGSTIGFLLSVSWSGMMMPIHWGGRPTYFPCSESNPVWTRCSKFRGLEISGLFLFFLNMVKYLSNTSNILVRINDRHTLVHLLAFTLHLQKKNTTNMKFSRALAWLYWW